MIIVIGIDYCDYCACTYVSVCERARTREEVMVVRERTTMTVIPRFIGCLYILLHLARCARCRDGGHVAPAVASRVLFCGWIRRCGLICALFCFRT